MAWPVEHDYCRGFAHHFGCNAADFDRVLPGPDIVRPLRLHQHLQRLLEPVGLVV